MSFLGRIEHMEAQVAFDQLRHQSVERAAAGCHKLQNLFAFPFPLKSAFNCLGLSLDPANAGQQLLFVFGRMRHFRPLYNNIVPYSIFANIWPPMNSVLNGTSNMSKASPRLRNLTSSICPRSISL